MNLRLTLGILSALLLAVLAAAQLKSTAPAVKPITTSPLIRPAPTLRPTANTYRTEVVLLSKADDKIAPNSRYFNRDPAQILRQNITDRNNGMIRLRTLISQAGRDGWDLVQMESMGQGGAYEEVLLVFKRPTTMPN